MQATLGELAQMVGGEVIGPADLVVRGAAPLRDVAAGQITLVDRQQNHRNLLGCSAAAVVAPRWLTSAGIPSIQVDDVHRAFAAIVALFRPERRPPRVGLSPLAVVSPNGHAWPRTLTSTRWPRSATT